MTEPPTKGNLLREVTSNFQTYGRYLRLGVLRKKHSRGVRTSIIPQQTRNQLGASFHAQLRENISQVKLHSLLADF